MKRRRHRLHAVVSLLLITCLMTINFSFVTGFSKEVTAAELVQTSNAITSNSSVTEATYNVKLPDANPAAQSSVQQSVYVSDLDWVSSESYWSPSKRDQSLDGNPLTSAGIVYSKGIGTHASSKIEYNLGPGYKRFTALAGIDDEVKSNPEFVKAKAKFYVKADDVVIASSPELKINETYMFNVSIPAGAKTLTLITDNLGDPTCDHTNWLDAKFLLSDGSDEWEPSEPVNIASPQGKVTSTIEHMNGRLAYSMKFNGKTVIENSFLGVIIEGIDIGERAVWDQAEVVTSSPDPVSYPWIGQHSTARDHHTLTTIPMINTITGMKYSLEVKLFDDGIAFRYVLPPRSGDYAISGESSSFKIPVDSTVWYQQNTISYEGKYTKQSAQSVPVGTKIGPPMTIKLPDNGGYAAITEGALVNYAGMTLVAEGNSTFKANFMNGGSWTLSGSVATPWRIVSVANDLNGLVNSDIVPNVNPPRAAIFDNNTDWIKPGPSTWSWVVDGDVSLKNMKLYIDYASELGIPYNLIDEGWTDWAATPDAYWAAVKEVVDYGKSKHVESWLWKSASDRSGVKGIFNRADRLAFFEKAQAAGVVGVKLDFIDGEERFKINFYRDTLEDAAKYQLMVNFHGANKPTGLSRTYPNEITREGIHGLEQGAPPADHNTTLPFTRYLAGHGDYTPMSFSNRMGQSSWSHQIATALSFTSPSLSFGEHPENMLMNPAVELIKSIPTAWDETIVLPGSEIGEVSAMARRSGTTWYVAVMNGLQERSLDVALSFLGSGNYTGHIYMDDRTKQDGYIIENKTVTSSSVLNLSMRGSGGYVAKFTKLDMEPFGGGFLDKRKVYLKPVDASSEIRYTLDGSEPTASSPKYENFIEITSSSVVRAKIMNGEGAGSAVSARFNKTSPYLQIVYDGERSWMDIGGKVAIQTNAEGSSYEIRYSIDGSEPTRDSLLYTEPFTLPVSSATIKAKLFVQGYGDSNTVSKTLHTFEHNGPVPPLPDVFLDQMDWVSATSGWANIPKKNKSIDGNKLTVAGQRYDHGLGTHANSDIVYNIPTGAKRFVAVAGTDDEVNENGGYASMYFKVYVDEKLLSSSPLVGKGMAWNFDVPLPDGAKQIRLSLNDAGDKNFDHGDWIHAGFMNTGPKVEPYTFISDGVLDRSSGIGAKVVVALTPGAEPRQGKQVIVFQLMNDITPVSIFAIESDPISTAKEFAAFFDIEDAAQLSYTVKVFVLDQLDQQLTASVSLAVPTLLK
ncbi:NPCBM/NEW2 domain-containing protein [Paenibacillus sp. FJAT-27812]|uniref:NPCBM/NEW2 domain-containing protein n=1 Tax=Paenibacillus sp. FJAT-27812 TaxID=1684143 RepID=UPI0006A7AD55|nr:NPCBM/NEW2 domain-containing protein [Paenibacillus sp. FJAT-27812]